MEPRPFPSLIRRILRPLLALGLLAAPVQAAKPDPNVLFIGNSYAEGVSNFSISMAKIRGYKGRIEAVTFGAMTLQGHLDKGDAVKKIAAGGWQYVILQEQSDTAMFPPEKSKIVTDPAVAELVKAIKAAGAKPLMFCNWPKNGGIATFEAQRDSLAANYTRLAKEQGVTLIPIGTAWDIVHREHPALQLHAPDGSHPSPAGAFLSACVIHGMLYGWDDIRKISTYKGLPEADAKILRDAASRAVPQAPAR